LRHRTIATTPFCRSIPLPASLVDVVSPSILPSSLHSSPAPLPPHGISPYRPVTVPFFCPPPFSYFCLSGTSNVIRNGRHCAVLCVII
jgi:hypothetical protein